MRKGVILYGPPASGKDTIANALVEHDPRFVKYQLLKAGPGNQDGYRMTTVEEIEKADSRGQILWKNDRYNATYAVDRAGFSKIMPSEVVIIQLGKVEAIDALKRATGTWIAVYLWCSRATAMERLNLRGGVNTSDRLDVWDQTDFLRANIVVDTGRSSVSDTVTRIASQVR